MSPLDSSGGKPASNHNVCSSAKAAQDHTRAGSRTPQRGPRGAFDEIRRGHIRTCGGRRGDGGGIGRLVGFVWDRVVVHVGVVEEEVRARRVERAQQRQEHFDALFAFPAWRRRRRWWWYGVMVSGGGGGGDDGGGGIVDIYD